MLEKFRLTREQEGLWIEWKMFPQNSSYNTCIKLRLTGDLDVQRFIWSTEETGRCFDGLKSYFIEEKGIPYQVLEPVKRCNLDYVDVSDGVEHETAETKKRALDILENHLLKPIDLRDYPLIHAAIVRSAKDVFYFVGVVPHIISDGVSAVLFLDSLSTAYNSGLEGMEERYGSTKKSWQQYVEYKEATFSQEKYDADTDYWREIVRDATHLVDFNTSRRCKRYVSNKGKRVYFDLTPELTQLIKSITSSQRTTLFTSLTAIFSVFLYKYFAANDILIGYPVNTRPAGFRHAFGFFINIIPLRVRLDGNPTFTELVARIHQQRKKDKKHQNYPSLDIVREKRKMQPDFDGRAFNVAMAQTVSRFHNLELEGVKSEPLKASYNDVNDDLLLSYEILEDRIGLWLEYREELFEKDFIDQAIGHIKNMAHNLAHNPDVRIDDIQFMEKPEIDKILYGWNKTEDAKSGALFVHEMFEKQAACSPDDTAIIFEGESISYAQLNVKANKLAHLLIDKGLKVGENVAIAMHSRPELIISLLAVMKAGGSYVPLDPNYPDERCSFIIEDSSTNIVITESSCKKRFSKLHKGSVIVVGSEVDFDKSCVGMPDSNPAIQIDKKAMAYTIYTSGSTGKPKGVLVRHDGVIARLAWLQKLIPLDSNQVMLQHTTYSFDISVCEIFWPIAYGAKLLLVKPDGSKDFKYMSNLIIEHKATVTTFVPSVLAGFLTQLKDATCQSLENVIAVGEILNPNTKNKFFDKFPSCNLYNMYGPTEASLYATYYKCVDDGSDTAIPIGKPLDDTDIYILDKDLNPQPPFVAGEIYIGGVGVADSYLNRPDLTEKHFIDDIFTGKAGSKIYKTGDTGFFDMEGNVQFLGRIDSQVKIRGFRIELGEIETILRKNSDIIDCTVVASTAAGIEPKLAAYLVTKSKKPKLKNIKEELARHVPGYMIPSYFVKLDAIPMTASGKVDQKQLPSPQENILKSSKSFVKPKSKSEKAMAKIWSDVLRVDLKSISLNDNFFELGGDSLMTIQVASLAEEEGLFFEATDIFEHKTISDLVAIAKTEKQVKASQETIVGDMLLTPRQEKFFMDDFAKPEHWNRCFSLSCKYKVNPEFLKQGIEAVIKHHDSLRVRFFKDDAGKWKAYNEDYTPTECFIKYDISHLNEADQRQFIKDKTEHYNNSFDFTNPPLMKVIFFKLSDINSDIAILLHHLTIDTVSGRLIVEDLMTAYQQIFFGKTLKLPSKTTSLKEVTQEMHDYLENGDFSQEIAYWKDKKLDTAQNIPIDNAIVDSDNIEANLECVIKGFDKDVTNKLMQSLALSNISLNHLLLASYAEAISEWTGDRKVLINTCGHGRDNIVPGIDTSKTVGWLNTVYPVLVDFDKYQSLEDIKAYLSDVPYGGYNYMALRYMKKQPDIAAMAEPEVFFNYLSKIDNTLPDGSPIELTDLLGKVTSSDGKNRFCYKMYTEVAVFDKELKIKFTYNKKLFNVTSVDNFLNVYRNKILDKIASHDSSAAAA